MADEKHLQDNQLQFSKLNRGSYGKVQLSHTKFEKHIYKFYTIIVLILLKE